MVKKVGKYEIGKTLGEGTFGKVKYAVNTETDERVAIKVLDKEKIQKQNMGAQIKKEISIMKMVRHKHVVVLKEVLASRTKIFIVLELITGGELFDKIVSEGRFSEETARFYFRQLVDGVQYCHENGVCHRDLKPENLLLDENGDLKISDFGLSALYEGGAPDGPESSRASLLHTTCGTPNYVAPEVLADKGYDGRAADVWSMGVILYIQKAEFSYRAGSLPRVKALLNRILVPDPETRISIKEILRDEWFVNANGADEQVAPAAGPGTISEELAVAPVPSPVDHMTIKPSQADLDAAILEHQDEINSGKKDKQDGGLKVMNAFDLINMCGGMALNRMFQSNDEKRVKRSTQFTSTIPAASIMVRLTGHLESLHCEINVENSSKVKAVLQTPKGAVGVVIQIFMLADNLHLVEVRRGKGDIFEYHKFYTQLNDQMKDLIADSGSS
ncbi:CBL-interacting serine/threonine-protein kinase, putative [Phytophthora infestans T30-4]|uniref:non-specific serine/threonine protein kinase n=1 Tax=Phytophthora infestans (strain T30-4) TaxID=403677 RepID=D0P3V4_PHYIT|nr:CBL-interacting serine/threonine-protein kinase, putative [Phytophthora infestans T30-4]EEY62050.1 CBL-interacting serine/threonine-protein kinase, putative [Phytophthora infestans T30-4]|eukprot:XP_002895016.1 CBL-interacting serine/threonine-protein kinase, putative [Phytophthora infestans T30-4]